MGCHHINGAYKYLVEQHVVSQVGAIEEGDEFGQLDYQLACALVESGGDLESGQLPVLMGDLGRGVAECLNGVENVRGYSEVLDPVVVVARSVHFGEAYENPIVKVLVLEVSQLGSQNVRVVVGAHDQRGDFLGSGTVDDLDQYPVIQCVVILHHEWRGEGCVGKDIISEVLVGDADRLVVEQLWIEDGGLCMEEGVAIGDDVVVEVGGNAQLQMIQLCSSGATVAQ